jgi:hypothetical protein
MSNFFFAAVLFRVTNKHCLPIQTRSIYMLLETKKSSLVHQRSANCLINIFLLITYNLHITKHEINTKKMDNNLFYYVTGSWARNY